LAIEREDRGANVLDDRVDFVHFLLEGVGDVGSQGASGCGLQGHGVVEKTTDDLSR